MERGTALILEHDLRTDETNSDAGRRVVRFRSRACSASVRRIWSTGAGNRGRDERCGYQAS